MIPSEFAATYRSTADQVSAGTGIDPIALLSQWANETNWAISWAGAPFNLANIERNGVVIGYTSLDAFAQGCIATFHNGFYEPVLVATNAVDQLAAIVASPWAAGHYGGSLDAYYQALEEFELTPHEHDQLQQIYNSVSGGFLTDAAGNQVPAPIWKAIGDDLAAIKTALANLQPGSATDLTPVLQAIAALDQKITNLTLKAVAA